MQTLGPVMPKRLPLSRILQKGGAYARSYKNLLLRRVLYDLVQLNLFASRSGVLI